MSSFTSYPEATEFIIRQQFHHPPGNFIVDRTEQRKFAIVGADEIVDFIVESIARIAFIWETDCEWFIISVTKFLLLPESDVKRVVSDKLAVMSAAMPITEDNIQNALLFYLTALGSIITYLREKVYNRLVEEIIACYPPVEPYKNEICEALVVDESLLLNIAVLYEFAKIAKYPLPNQILKKEMALTISRMMKRSETIGVFFQEYKELIQTANNAFSTLVNPIIGSTSDRQLHYNTLFRVFHTLKGNSAFLDLRALMRFCAAYCEFFREIKDNGSYQLTERQIKLIKEGLLLLEAIKKEISTSYGGYSAKIDSLATNISIEKDLLTKISSTQ